MKKEYVCFNCFHIFKQRKENAIRSCSQCKSRTVVELPMFVSAVEETKDWLKKRELSFKTPLMAFKEIPIIRKMLRNSYFPRGINALCTIIEIAIEWNPKIMSAEDCIILYLRRRQNVRCQWSDQVQK